MRMNEGKVSYVWHGMRVLGVALPLVWGANAGAADELPAGFRPLPDDARNALIKEGLGENPFMVIGINNKGEIVTFVPANVDIVNQLTVKFNATSNQHEAYGASFVRLDGSNSVLACFVPAPPGSPPCSGATQNGH
jgi:hypothetical protein